MIKRTQIEKESLEALDYKVLLVINRGLDRDMKVLVQLHTKMLINQVKTLLAENKELEAFNLVVSQGQVLHYIPPGRKLKVKPVYTFVEDILS